MQVNFPKPVLPIEIKISDLERYFSKKIQKVSKNCQKIDRFDFSESHIFLSKIKMAKTAYTGELKIRLF